MRTAVQLYTFRDADVPPSEQLELVAEWGFDGVEFAGFDPSDVTGVADAIAASALEVAGAHVDVDRLEDAIDEVVGLLRPLECNTVVIPRLDESSFSDTAAVEVAARRLSTLAARLEERDFELQYHNHDHEFRRLDGTSGFERLVDRASARVEFELDVGWATAAGCDPVELMDRFGDRISMIHLKDVDDGVPVELGEGDVDVDGCLQAARRIGVEWVVFEHDDPADPVASIETAAARLATDR